MVYNNLYSRNCFRHLTIKMDSLKFSKAVSIWGWPILFLIILISDLIWKL